MLERVIVKYYKAPTTLGYSIGSVSSSPLEREKVAYAVEGVLTGV